MTKLSDQLSEQITIRQTVMKTMRIVALVAFISAMSGCGSSGTQDGAVAGAQSTGNSAPIISGSPPAEVNAGETYSFTPTVTDPDDTTFSFTESGLPLWLDLNEGTGEISGMPQAGDVGTYSGISITVSDGEAQDTLGPFTITVSEVVVQLAPGYFRIAAGRGERG